MTAGTGGIPCQTFPPSFSPSVLPTVPPSQLPKPSCGEFCQFPQVSILPRHLHWLDSMIPGAGTPQPSPSPLPIPPPWLDHIVIVYHGPMDLSCVAFLSFAQFPTPCRYSGSPGILYYTVTSSGSSDRSDLWEMGVLGSHEKSDSPRLPGFQACASSGPRLTFFPNLPHMCVCMPNPLTLVFLILAKPSVCSVHVFGRTLL